MLCVSNLLYVHEHMLYSLQNLVCHVFVYVWINFSAASCDMEEDDYINPKVPSVTSPLNDSTKVSHQTAVSDDAAYYNCPQQSGQQYN